MIPLHFGRSERLLFGVYTPAVEPRARRGVVICNPWGIEALRAHRAMRHLSQLLSASGLDVLRFDYSGTGDSFGNPSAARLGDWIEDSEFALDELLAVSGIRQAAMVGLRMGSYIAAAAAARRPADVDRVVLWEPVFRGSAHVAELLNGSNDVTSGEIAIFGFPLPPALRGDLDAASLHGLPGSRFRVHMFHSSPPPGAPDVSAKEVAVTHIQSDPCWVEERQFGAGAAPVELLRRIAEWLK